ncbi:OmpA family protein [Minwuia sp.]|uniref:OmpA family protein n=1 Tax=Minwuia sp. TaxID=2493630 RepID=UPI003A8CB4AB
MKSAPFTVRNMRNGIHWAPRAGVCGMLMLLGACSVPDWADPTSYFEPGYGPVPQPVARGGNPALPPAQPAPGLASATQNIQRSGENPVISVTRGSATTPTAATPRIATAEPAPAPAPAPVAASPAPAPTPARDVVAIVEPIREPEVKPATPVAAAPAPSQTEPSRTAIVDRVPAVARPEPPRQIAEAPVPAAVRVQEAEPVQNVRRTRAPARSDESPTPMIAAMTRGQQPPSFSEDGAVVPRRTEVQASDSISLNDPEAVPAPARSASDDEAPRRTAAAARPASAPIVQTRPSPTGTPRGSQTASAGQSTAMASQTSAIARPVDQPTLSRTYSEQLRAAGIEPVTPSAAPTGRVPPGQFPSSVSPVVQQTYQDSLNAPRTYQEVVGGYPASAPVAGGPVVIDGGTVQQAAAYGVPAGVAGAPDTVIQFRHGSAQLSSSDLGTLRATAERARQTNATVRVRGHSSSRTGQMPVDTHLLANLRMSAARAEAVADALARFGVPYDRIVVEAKGDNAPVFNEAMPSGEAGNRRAEIFLEN